MSAGLFSIIIKKTSQITPYRTAASVPLTLCRCVELLHCRRLWLAGSAFTWELLLLRDQSWLQEQFTSEDDSGSEFSASNSWLSCRASNGLAGAGAAGTVIDRGKQGHNVKKRKGKRRPMWYNGEKPHLPLPVPSSAASLLQHTPAQHHGPVLCCMSAATDAGCQRQCHPGRIESKIDTLKPHFHSIYFSRVI